MKSGAFLREATGSSANLDLLVQQHPDEWANFEHRMRARGLVSAAVQDIRTAFLEGLVNAELDAEVRLWASYRTQTVGRTIRGALEYHRALKRRLGWAREGSPHVSLTRKVSLNSSFEGSRQSRFSRDRSIHAGHLHTSIHLHTHSFPFSPPQHGFSALGRR